MIFREDCIYYSRLIESGEWSGNRQMYSWIIVPPGKALCGCVVEVGAGTRTRFKASPVCPTCGGSGAA